MENKKIEFLEVVKIDGTKTYVDVPESVLVDLGCSFREKVLVKIHIKKIDDVQSSKPSMGERDNDTLISIERLTQKGWYRTTLVYLKNKPVRLYLDTCMRDSTQVKVGDQVRVKMMLDRESRNVSIPEMLLKALEENEEAYDAWDALEPSGRKEIKLYLNFLKSEEKREEKIIEVVQQLSSK